MVESNALVNSCTVVATRIPGIPIIISSNVFVIIYSNPFCIHAKVIMLYFTPIQRISQTSATEKGHPAGCPSFKLIGNSATRKNVL
jgi:hypothetical protein